MTDQLCQGCAQVLPPKKAPGGKPRKWCSDRCRRWYGLRGGTPRPTTRNCLTCGFDISQRFVVAKYCSTECGQVARGERRAEPLAPLACAFTGCGKSFTPKYHNQRCCSERCGKRRWHEQAKAEGRTYREPWNDRRRDRYHRRRAQMYAAPTGETVRRDEIAARDAYRCHLCRKRVDMARVWPDPLSPTLDHLVPLSKGGAHEPANVRLAHAECNLSKGNRPRGEQLLLIG